MTQQMDTYSVENLPTQLITAGENDRTVFGQFELDELASSIEKDGLAQPITIRDLPDGTYQIVAGERRFRAMLSLGWTSIPSIIRKGMSDGEASAIMLAENISRKDLDPVDEAMAYQKRFDLFGWEPAEIAKRCGVSLDRIRKRLKLTSVRPDILSMVRSGQFPTGHAEAISVLDHNRQMIAARPLISGQPINLRQFQVIVGQLLSEQQTESLFDISSFLQSPGSQSEISTQKVKVDAAKDLPIVRPNCGRHTGEVIYNYIQDLLRVGLTREAEVCGALLVGLDSSNFARIPVESKIETGIEILRNS